MKSFSPAIVAIITIILTLSSSGFAGVSTTLDATAMASYFSRSTLIPVVKEFAIVGPSVNRQAQPWSEIVEAQIESVILEPLSTTHEPRLPQMDQYLPSLKKRMKDSAAASPPGEAGMSSAVCDPSSGLATHGKKAVIQNYCPFPVYLWEVSDPNAWGKGRSPALASGYKLEPGTCFANDLHFTSEGGISIKLTKHASLDGPTGPHGITQMEYHMVDKCGNFMYYDISNVDCDAHQTIPGSCPFWEEGLRLQNGKCAKQQCKKGVRNCDEFYQVYNNDDSTKFCDNRYGHNAELYLCSGRKPNGFYENHTINTSTCGGPSNHPAIIERNLMQPWDDQTAHLPSPPTLPDLETIGKEVLRKAIKSANEESSSSVSSTNAILIRSLTQGHYQWGQRNAIAST